MKERPVIFSGPLIRAILEGRKTQTRCVIKPQPPGWCERGGVSALTPPGHWEFRGSYKGACKFIRCPYLPVSETRLWVRETWAPCIGGPCEPGNPVLYRADDEPIYDRLVWNSSIFMPRWASRITLELTGVRAERVQEITDDDAYRERGFGWKQNPWVWVLNFRVLKPVHSHPEYCLPACESPEEGE